jgi:hypothetical protein
MKELREKAAKMTKGLKKVTMMPQQIPIDFEDDESLINKV